MVVSAAVGCEVVADFSCRSVSSFMILFSLNAFPRANISNNFIVSLICSNLLEVDKKVYV